MLKRRLFPSALLAGAVLVSGTSACHSGGATTPPVSNGTSPAVRVRHEPIAQTGYATKTFGNATWKTPSGIAFDGTFVYVADPGNQTVYKINSKGQAQALALSSDPVALAVDSGGDLFVAAADSSVTEYPKNGAPIPIGMNFNKPRGVAVAAGGVVYVADTGNGVVTSVTPPFNTSTNGTMATVPGSYLQPTGVAVDNVHGNIYVTDFANNALYEVSNSVATAFASPFQAPQGVCVDSSGDIYVTTAGAPPPFTSATVPSVYRITSFSSATMEHAGSGFFDPVAVAAGAAGTMYVADYGTAFKTGTLPGSVYSISTQGTQTALTTIGNFIESSNISLDPKGNIYVANTSGNIISLVSQSGVRKAIGSGFKRPLGVAVANPSKPASLEPHHTSIDPFLVADSGNKLVKWVTFSRSGAQSVQQIGRGFQEPSEVALDGVGNVYVSDFIGGEVDIVEPPFNNGTNGIQHKFGG